MKAILLYNTQAGKGRVARHLDKIVEIFRAANIDICPKIIDFTKNPFDGEENTELAVVCGGDGTINFVVNKMQEKGLNVTLGIIPSGTANDFAGAIGCKRNILRAAKQIAEGSERRVDCGVVNGTYFVTMCFLSNIPPLSRQEHRSFYQTRSQTGYYFLSTNHKKPQFHDYLPNQGIRSPSQNMP